MGRVTKDEQAQIERIQDATGIKLTREQIVKILNRNPFEKKPPGRPISKRKNRGTQTTNSSRRFLQESRREAVKAERRNKTETEPEPLHRLFGEFREWEVDLVNERNSPRYPNTTVRSYRIRIPEGQIVSPSVVNSAILGMIKEAIARSGPEGNPEGNREILHSNRI